MGQRVDAPGTAGGCGLKASEFREVQTLAYDAFGLELKSGKEALVAARLSKRVRELDLAGIGQYLDLVRADRTGVELASLIDALATNFTSFLREHRHFELLAQRILPELAERAAFTIWCAGCATGEEPYSILFQAAETLGVERLGKMSLIATDISTRALEAARAGIFGEARLSEIPEPWRKRFFQRGTGAQAGRIRVKDEWRARLRFERLNLMEDFGHLPGCAVIFCRNVMIYFDKAVQQQLVARFASQLDPGGWLLIGHSEGLMGIRHGLDYVMPAVYRKPGGARDQMKKA